MKGLKRKKRLNRNIFHIQITHDEIYNLFIFELALSAVYEILKQFLGDNDLLVIAVSTVAYIALLLFRKRQERTERVRAYEKSNTFVGLFSIEESKEIEAHVDNGLISREREVEYIDGVLRTIWEQQIGHKRGICPVGASGCGKSTILNLLEYGKYRKTEAEYDIYNFSDKYNFLDKYLKDTFGIDYVENIQKRQTILLLF